ncbi:zf-HC2 domain-containing protein [Granulicella arctica]|uniref:zf-HC2 domain-containing protein n=1 Tax=Granulicella arctica TaxID=940613 RepID=UPI0021E0A457|nr:zf-HC2 domain-containing protein [Granulicella arctica]
MTHHEAVEQMAVERYLLGELSGEPRDRFEEHLFDCQECAADLKQSVLFLEGAKAELKSEGMRVVRPMPQKTTSRIAWLWRPQLLAPALAACLAVIVYQSAILLPHLRTEVAASQTPALLEPFVLANAGARGDTVPEIHVPKQGVYALSVDIPPAPNAAGYRCSLYSAAGALVWHVDVSQQQARDAVMIQVPVMTAQEGMNELRVQSITSSGPENTLAVLASYRYKLVFQK